MIIPAILYEYIYLIIVGIFTIVLTLQYVSYSNERLLKANTSSVSIVCIVLTIFMIIFIGTRPLSGVFIDMMNYKLHYDILSEYDFEFDPEARNLLFGNIERYIAMNDYDIEIFFIIMAFIYFGGIYWSIRRIFPNDTLFAFVVYLAAFSTFSYATNGIKAGAAASIFLVALCYYDKKIISAIFCLLSLGFHHSMILPIVAYAISIFYNKPKYLIWFWVICLGISFLHITFFQELFAEIGDDKAEQYLALENLEDWGGKQGFRLDFVAYSSVVVGIGWWVYDKIQLPYRSLYSVLYSTYLITNGVWMLCMYANFTNRIAYLSWALIPILIIYPFLKFKITENQYQKAVVVSILHYCFTLFLEL